MDCISEISKIQSYTLISNDRRDLITDQRLRNSHSLADKVTKRVAVLQYDLDSGVLRAKDLGREGLKTRF